MLGQQTAHLIGERQQSVSPDRSLIQLLQISLNCLKRSTATLFLLASYNKGTHTERAIDLQTPGHTSTWTAIT